MISRVSSNNKGKQAKMKNSVKKQRSNKQKKKVQRNRKQRRGEVEHGISARASNSLTTAPQ